MTAQTFSLFSQRSSGNINQSYDNVQELPISSLFAVYTVKPNVIITKITLL